MNRRHAVVASLRAVSMGGAAALVACGGGDDSSSGSPTADSGPATVISTPDAMTTVMTTPDASESNDASDAGIVDAQVTDAPVTLDAAVTSMTIYAGQIATLNASGMAAGEAVTYEWTLSSAPSGSSVVTGSIIGGATATPSLPTDKPGTYLLTVVATAEGQTAQATVSVVAMPAHVIYAIDIPDAASSYSLAATVDTDGTNGHTVICPFQDTTNSAASAAVSASDTFEGAPGTPTKIVFGGPQKSDAGVGYSKLYVTDTTGTCPAPAVGGANATVIYQASGSLSTSPDVNTSHPRFSPDGTKIVFNVSKVAPAQTNCSFLCFPQPDMQSTVNVINTDGGSFESLGLIVDSTANNAGYFAAGMYEQAEWMDATHVGWPRSEKDAGAGAGWDLVVSSVPQVTGEPSLYMSCTGSSPIRTQFLADGSVVAVYAPVSNGPTDLFVLKPDANKVCAVVHNLSHLGASASSIVTAFALSPDKKTVVYAANDVAVNDSGAQLAVVYQVPVDGSSNPVVLGPSANVDLAAGIRFVGGGGTVAFTRSAFPDGGGARSLSTLVPAVPGAAPTDLVISSASSSVTAGGNGDSAACTFGGKSAPAIGFFASALALLGIARRRQRRSVVSGQPG